VRTIAGASAPGAESARISRSAAHFIAGFPGETETSSGELLDFLEEAELEPRRLLCVFAVAGARANELPARFRTTFAKNGVRGSCTAGENKRARLKRKLGKTIKVLVTR